MNNKMISCEDIINAMTDVAQRKPSSFAGGEKEQEEIVYALTIRLISLKQQEIIESRRKKLLKYKKRIEQIIGPFSLGKMRTIEEIASYGVKRMGVKTNSPISYLQGYMTAELLRQNLDEYIAMRNIERFGQPDVPDTISILLDENVKKRVEEFQSKHRAEYDSLMANERLHYMGEYINSLYIEDEIPFDPRLHPRDTENGRFVRTYREYAKKQKVKKTVPGQINGTPAGSNGGNRSKNSTTAENLKNILRPTTPAKKAFGLTDEEDEFRKSIFDRCSRILHNPENSDEEKDKSFFKTYLENHPAAKSALAKMKKIAEENIFPQRISGAKQGVPMSHEKADSGKVNPEYDPKDDDDEYHHNCQVCVVVYEMRLRGYKIKAGLKVEELSANSAIAWLDPETGLPPEIHNAGLKSGDNKEDPIKPFADKLKEGERYHLVYGYHDTKTMHVVTITRDGDNIIVYDPQPNETNEWHSIESIPDNIRLESLVYYRVDNMALNPMFKNIVSVPSEDRL
jgi:hypothetical protein